MPNAFLYLGGNPLRGLFEPQSGKFTVERKGAEWLLSDEYTPPKTIDYISMDDGKTLLAEQRYDLIYDVKDQEFRLWVETSSIPKEWRKLLEAGFWSILGTVMILLFIWMCTELGARDQERAMMANLGPLCVGHFQQLGNLTVIQSTLLFQQRELNEVVALFINHSSPWT